MNSHILFLVMHSVFLFACWETKPKWDEPSFGFKDIRLDSIEICEFNYQGLSPLTDSLSIYSKLGSPDTFYLKSYNGQLLKDYKFFKSKVIIGQYIDAYKIRYINFQESSLNISLNGFRLDSRTSLKKAKEMFPNSFDWRNLGIAISSLELREKYEYQKVKFDHLRIILVDADRKYLGWIELSFVDNRLEILNVERPQDIIQR